MTMSMVNSLSMEQEVRDEEHELESIFGGESSSCDGIGHESDSLGGELLQGLDSYLNDIDDRLIISRMVNDSVIKGILSAIAQDAEQSVKVKEFEIDELKRELGRYRFVDEGKFHRIDELLHLQGSGFCGVRDTVAQALPELIAEANVNFARLQRDIDNMQGFVPLVSIGSGTEMNGQEDEILTDAYKSLHSLKLIVESAFELVDNAVHVCDTSLREHKHDLHFQNEIEAMVMRQGILGLEEKIALGLQKHEYKNHGSSYVDWLDSIRELSKLRMDFDVISKSLLISDDGLASQGSAEIGDEKSNAKISDVLHRKTLLFEGTANRDSQIIIPENLECTQFKHMTRESLFNHLKSEMIKMKRDHESAVLKMTEKYFSFQRKAPSMHSKKDKEFNALQKQIPEVIRKLDVVLCKNDNVTRLRNSVEGIDKLNSRLNNALSENNHLKSLLNNTQKEVKRLSVLAADAQDKMSQHSLTEINLRKKIHNLNNTIQDTRTEVIIIEEINKCIFKEMEFIFNDRLKSFTRSIKERVECQYPVQRPYMADSDFVNMITQELLGIALIETVKRSEESLCTMHAKSAKDSGLIVILQKTISQKKNALKVALEVEGQLIKELNLLKETVNEKEQVIREVRSSLIQTKEDFEVLNREAILLKENADAQKLLASSSINEITDLKSRLAQVYEQKSLLEVQIDELNGKHEFMLMELSKMTEERAELLVCSKDSQSTLSSLVIEKEEHRKQVELMLIFVQRLSKEVGDFECRVSRDTEINNSRLEDARSQLIYLIKKCNLQRRTGLMYKQRLERKNMDLQKAEAEVDLLGDEVDVLVDLLEKIYIALDHYSPILKHYPGIVEVLKLVKRELSGESNKQNRRQLSSTGRDKLGKPKILEEKSRMETSLH